MMALINTPLYEEVMEDINNVVFNVVQPKYQARLVWSILEELASNGSSEEFLYQEMNRMIKEYNVDQYV